LTPALAARIRTAIAERNTYRLATVLTEALAYTFNDDLVAETRRALDEAPAETQLWWTGGCDADGGEDANDRRVLLEMLTLDVPDGR
jgi:hypothetical protein